MTVIDKIKTLMPAQKQQPIKSTSPHKFVGMSRSKTPIKQPQKQDTLKIVLSKPDFTSVIKPILPYLYVVQEDLARIVGKDSKSVKMKEDYNDFMEQHFKRKDR